METVKPKRFSFSGFGSSLTRSLSFNKPKEEEIVVLPPQESDDEQRRNKRAQKSKSLYIKSFRKIGTSSDETTPKKTEFDAAEATQTNSKEIKSSIRRSLSAVLYATPHATSGKDGNKLVPILVTPGLSESVGGILISDAGKSQEKEEGGGGGENKKKKKPVEYDNTLEVFPNKKNDAVTILWQGYGYTVLYSGEEEEVASEILEIQENVTETPQYLKSRFEKETWTSYRGLIHPLHLFQDKDEVTNRGRWAGLSVSELRRYYDNYGSMMLKIREARMLQQQKQYHCISDAKKEWIIIPATEVEQKEDKSP
ncbi:uncharacterized protein B0P05DRAFT_550858 [Gilbertella persicaria]|uniref:uncharacterized protein n=1 Tax=Gilbertella persicaria TaxID=101096 RepID=UPI002220C9EE|nr:uncharacterized protein B0P05DRAFT_550858 [Gilbertella persicaria]KAI8069784.1 hypothetical protein B0P05DRAFT_550858 [Gilbertella persicaria]